MPGALFQERCRCASHRPGISVAPMPSITVWPPAPTEGMREEPRVTERMRLPCTATSPVKGYSPEPSRIRTLVKSHVAVHAVVVRHRLFLPVASSGFERPDEIRGELAAFLRPL